MPGLELEKLSLFKGLEPADLDQVREKVRERVYPKDATVFVAGQESDGLYIIYSGLVKVYILHSDGREKTLALLGRDEILGEVTLFGSDLRSATLETLEVTTLLVISRSDFQTLLLDNPRLSVRVIELLSRRLRQANRHIEELTFLNARSRVTSTLLHLAEAHGRPARNADTRIARRLTHAELAKLVGVTRETVTKVLGELQDDKLIRVVRGEIVIADMDGLRQRVL